MRFKAASLFALTGIVISAAVSEIYSTRSYPPHIGKYEMISVWGESYFAVAPSPESAKIFVPTRPY